MYCSSSIRLMIYKSKSVQVGLYIMDIFLKNNTSWKVNNEQLKYTGIYKFNMLKHMSLTMWVVYSRYNINHNQCKIKYMQLFAVIDLWTLLYIIVLYSWVEKLYLFLNYITNVLINETEASPILTSLLK